MTTFVESRLFGEDVEDTGVKMRECSYTVQQVYILYLWSSVHISYYYEAKCVPISVIDFELSDWKFDEVLIEVLYINWHDFDLSEILKKSSLKFL